MGDEDRMWDWQTRLRLAIAYRFWFTVAYVSETRFWWYVARLGQRIWPRVPVSDEERLVKFLTKQGLPQQYIDDAVAGLRLNLS